MTDQEVRDYRNRELGKDIAFRRYEQAEAKKPKRVVVEVRGGLVLAVYADINIEAVIVDWDRTGELTDDGEIECDYAYGEGIAPLSDMDDDVKEEVEKFGIDPEGNTYGEYFVKSY